MKVALCTPCHSQTEAAFAHDWVRLAVHTTKELGADVRPFIVSSSNLVGNRELLTDAALEWGAGHILWIDADQTFPANGLARLLGAKKPVIGANIPRRGRPTGPTAARIVDGKRELIWTTPELAKVGAIEQVDHIGLGFCLVDAKVIERLTRPLFVGPHEDYHFSELLRAAGVEIYIDHAVSWQIGHIYSETLTHVEALADRVAWKMREAQGLALIPITKPS